MKKSILIAWVLLSHLMLAQTDLLFKPVVGKTYKALAKVDMVIDMDIEKTHISVPTKTDLYYDMVVKSIDPNGDVHVEYKTTRVLFQATDPKTKKTEYYDSDKPQKTAEYKKTDEKFRQSIGKTAAAKYNNKAELIEADSNISSIQAEGLLKLPAEKVKVGSQWDETKTNDESGTEITTKTTYKVTKIEANLVTLESSSTSEVLKKPMLGTYILDAKTGVIKTSKGSGVMDMGMMQMKISADYSIQ